MKSQVSAKDHCGHRFDEELRFLRGWIDQPRTVGSILPTSQVTARRMASVIDLSSGLPVLELGPGTGAITRAILARGVKPQNLHAVEHAEDFALHLRAAFPGVNVIRGDAFDLPHALGEAASLTFDAAISGVPLLNFPVESRIAFVEGALSFLPAGRPLVQFTYGPRSPVPRGGGAYTVEHFGLVFRNVPPANLWIYRSTR